MGKSKSALAALTAISVLISAPVAAAQMTCSIDEKHHCEAGSECQRIENTMSMRIDLNRKIYSRCDESGCDEFQAQILQQGNVYNINLANVLAQVSSVDQSFVEIATFNLRTYVSFGKCRDVGQ